MLLLYLLRGIFVLIVACIAFLYADQIPAFAQHRPAVILLGVVGAGLIIVMDMIWPRKSLRALAGVLFGLLAGMVVTYVFSLVVTFLASVFASPTPERPELVESVKTAEKQIQEATTGIAETIRMLDNSGGLSAQETEELRKKLGEHERDARNARIGLMSAMNVPDTKDFLLQFIKFMVGAVTCYLTISFVMQTKDDFRFVVPYVEFSRQTKGARPFLLDTSVIIDGRIAEVCHTGVIESEVVVPKFVLQELQTIADSRDGMKRKRGRRGLDVLNAMQGDKSIDLVIRDLGLPEETEGKVDELLVEAAERTDGRVVTNDYNLNKITRLRGVDVINLNDLANALKPVFLPGEGMKLRIVKPGEGPSQGVGYLEDGTMVVVEQARGLINQAVEVVVTSSLQTSAGRLIFGKLADDSAGGSDRRGAGRQNQSRPRNGNRDNRRS